jgi:hypothetical protein
MTLDAFIKTLEKLRDQGHGRCHVVVDKDSLWDCNGDFDICRVSEASCEIVYVGDGDGGIAYTAKGVERTTRNIVIRGENG